ncbi:MAG: flagellar basal-body MS-ring/collar protein FliF [Pseudomonadota bacterium]
MSTLLDRAQVLKLSENLKQLGAQRLITLGLVGFFAFLAVGVGTYYLSRPTMEVLYTGLEAQDVGRMVTALEGARIPFDVNPEGTSILVPYGAAARARALLAQQQLPSGSSSGYELFDQLGSMGLTSFMQEVTRVRALEGEIARTVQSMQGIQAARVHLVLPVSGSFRRKQSPPSASVVVRLIGNRGGFDGTQAIRYIVAAAVPGMKLEQISVLSTEGTVLAAAGSSKTRAPQNMLALEKSVSDKLQGSAERTLAPYLGIGNYQVSVSARINTDKREVSEQTFDPKSRVERSVRVVKQEGTTENRSGAPAVGVDQNVPEEEGDEAGGDQSKRQEERREELTNYELNSRTVQTVSNGYRIDGLTIAVLINKKRLIEGLGAGASDEAIASQIERLKRLVTAATGLSAERGDLIEIAAVDFLPGNAQLSPVPGLGITGHLLRHTGTLINAAVALAIVFLIIWFAVRPTVGVLSQEALPAGAAGVGGSDTEIASNPTAALEVATADEAETALLNGADPDVELTAQERLEQLVETEEAQVVAILKQWIRKGVEA